MDENELKILTLSGLGNVLNQIEGKYSTKYSKTILTLFASSWSGNAPYTIDVPVTGINENDDIQIIPCNDWTLQQAEAWMSASILSGDCSTDTITLKAYGVKPTIDIPVTVLIGSQTIQKGGS